MRDDSISHMNSDLEQLLKDQPTEQEERNTIAKIIDRQYDAQVHGYIIELAASDKLCKFIVEHKLYSFNELVLEFKTLDQKCILTSIYDGFSEATGYGGWSNYNIFSQITYNLYLKLEDLELKKISRQILEECAEVNFDARQRLEKLPD